MNKLAGLLLFIIGFGLIFSMHEDITIETGLFTILGGTLIAIGGSIMDKDRFDY